MKKTVKIKVLAKDIKDGVPHECESCPVALAILRQMKGSQFVSVNGETAIIKFSSSYIIKDGGTFDLPAKVETFVNNFDSGKKVKPFEFTMKLQPIN